MQRTEARPSSAVSSEAKLHFLDYWRVIRVRFGIVLLSFLLVVITAAVTTYFLPRKFRSTITLELRSPNVERGVFREGNNYGISSDYVLTQLEIIPRKEILYPVVDTLDLPRTWAVEGTPISREQAYWKLRSMLNIKPVRGTGVLDLGVTSTNPKEAATLVNAVVQSYQDAQRSSLQVMNKESQSAIITDLEGQRAKVEKLNRQLLDMLKNRPDLDDPTMDRASAEGGLDRGQVQINNRQEEVNKISTEVVTLQSQLKQIEGLKGDELMRALPQLLIPDPTVQRVLPLYQEADSGEAALLNSGLGPNHPNVKSLRASRETYKKQLTDQIASIRGSLAITLDVKQKTLDSVKKQLEDARNEQRIQRASSVDYNQVKSDYLTAKKLLDASELSASKGRIEDIMPRTPALIWEKAEPSQAPYSPNIYLNMAIGVLVGIMVGVGLAFFIEYLDTSVKTMDDVENMLGVPVLAIVPKNIKLLHKQTGDVPDAEAYRILRTNIEFNRKSADANTISMVSGGPGEGKSTTISNLAFTCAQGGYSVLIVDADLRRPTQHKIFEMSNTIGLTNYLTTNATLEEVIFPTAAENLYLMPSGILPADAVGILNSQRMSDMIAELKTRFDIIFFDSPPILGVSDGAVLASEVDQSIIVVQHRRFPRAMLQRVKQSITNVGGTVLGVVLNNVDLRHDPNYAYYTSYYEYYSNTNTGSSEKASRSSSAAQSASTAGQSRKGGANSSEY